MSRSETEIPEVSAAEAHEDLGRYRVLDVREAAEFHGPLGFIECADLVPLSTLSEQAPRLEGDRPLLLVCRSGRRSMMACEKLRAMGVEDVTNLAGGMIGWNQAGLPVGRSEPKSLTALVDQIVSWVSQVSPLSKEDARDVVRKRLHAHGVSYHAPSHAAVDALIDFVSDSLLAPHPPDLDICVTSFRLSLAVL